MTATASFSSRNSRIMGLALPIIGGMASQNLLNLVDTAMVGVLGNEALAAIGMSNNVLFMCQALVMGISTAVQTMASRRKGEGDERESVKVLNSALLSIAVVVPIFTIILMLVVPLFYPFLISDKSVVRQSLPYLDYRIIGTIFIGCNFSFRGFWSAIDRTGAYMSSLILMNVSNIIFNYIFIFGHFGSPAMGVGGAGLASLLATALGTSYYFFLGFRDLKKLGFLKTRLNFAHTITLAKQTIPNGLQQFMFALGFVAMFWIIGKIGTPELAAANVLINITLVALFPGMGFGMAASTLVGQALGRRDANDASRWGFDVLKVAAIVMASIGLPMIIIPEILLKGFIHDPATIAIAIIPLRLMGIFMPFEAVGTIFMFALLGAGDAKRVMITSICTQWLVFLPMAYVAGPILGYGLLAVWILQGGYRVLLAAIFTRIWLGRKWAAVKV
jgi:multidrug resistance protein, MATE family